jgi:hypothetical protein
MNEQLELGITPQSSTLVPTRYADSYPGRTTRAARRYISPRSRPLSAKEQETRVLAYALKNRDCPESALQLAAREMAELIIGGPVHLVPAPSHTGDTAANRRLAHAIAGYVAGATVHDILTRTEPAPSACDRHRLRLPQITVAGHHIVRRPGKPIPCKITYIVDNVTTSGTTIKACIAALGFGTGLVFADATFHRYR